MITIYHNPNCSKSNATIDLLKIKKVEFKVVEYLKEPLTVAFLQSLVTKLGLKPIDILRKNEVVYLEKYGDKELTDTEIFEAIVTNPILLQRPIIVKGDKAVIGRPPSNVLALL